MKLLKRIDVHGHYFPPAYQKALEKHEMGILDGFPAPKWDECIQNEYMEGLNLLKSVLSISSPYFYFGDRKETEDIARACNEYGSDYQKRNHAVHICGVLPLPDVEAAVNEVKYCRDKLGICDFSMLSNTAGIYLGDKRLEPLMEELNKEQTVLVLHPTSPAAMGANIPDTLPVPAIEYFFETTRAVTNMIINGTIHRHSNIKFLVPHGGACLTILSDRLAFMTEMLRMDGVDVMGDLAKLYYDLAGMAMPKQYGLLKEVTDTSHILYGSDAPFTSLTGDQKLAGIMDSSIESSIQEQIYVLNAEKLFRMKETEE